MTDPRVEEIREDLRALIFISDGTKGSDKVARLLNAIPYLLTKLDEAEREMHSRELHHFESEELLEAAEERERTLIAGVKELAVLLPSHRPRHDSTGGYRGILGGFNENCVCGAHWVRDDLAEPWQCPRLAILSRLLPSTPTEEVGHE